MPVQPSLSRQYHPYPNGGRLDSHLYGWSGGWSGGWSATPTPIATPVPPHHPPIQPPEHDLNNALATMPPTRELHPDKCRTPQQYAFGAADGWPLHGRLHQCQECQWCEGVWVEVEVMKSTSLILGSWWMTFARKRTPAMVVA